MTIPLFEADPAQVLPPPTPVSPERRRRERQADALAHGLHPLTAAVRTAIRLHPAAAPTDDRTAAGRRCGGCQHRQLSPVRHARPYPKCAFDSWSRATNGPGTDVRAWWPACTDHEPSETAMTQHATGLRPGHRPPPDGPHPTHPCPAGCGRPVTEKGFACPEDWYRLPFTLRQPISSNYNRDKAAHATAMEAARDWYRHNPVGIGPAAPGPVDPDPPVTTFTVSRRAPSPRATVRGPMTRLDPAHTKRSTNLRTRRTEIWEAVSFDGRWHYERQEDDTTTWTVKNRTTGEVSPGWPSLSGARRHTASETTAAAKATPS